ncbi:BMP family ABC transporter substrate-binding protein [Candidatus Thorarchaeota archaeon]|nr:MAG: BMP family ABC transporter substrate-binding protein [Candidatus Thorarchaeota archaeon]
MSSRSSILASVIIVVVVFSAVGGFIFMTNPYVPAKIAVVVSEPGFGDLSMADQVLAGLEALGGDIIVDYQYFTAADQAAAQTILETNSASTEFDLIVVIGGELADELQTVAANHLNQKYAFIGGEVVANNVYSATFIQSEGAFLAGALAALTCVGDVNRTGTSIAGIVASVATDPVVISLIAGFKQGFEHANTTYNLNVTLLPEVYVGSYNDTAEAESLALDMYDPDLGNASIIFAPVRASMQGIRNAMIQANATWYNNTLRRPLAIAAEGDQDYYGLPNIETNVGSSWIITSVVPRSDLAVYDVINATLWNEFEGATLAYDLDNDLYDPELEEFVAGVALTRSESINFQWVPLRFFDAIDDMRLGILNGTITVSETYP